MTLRLHSNDLRSDRNKFLDKPGRRLSVGQAWFTTMIWWAPWTMAPAEEILCTTLDYSAESQREDVRDAMALINRQWSR